MSRNSGGWKEDIDRLALWALAIGIGFLFLTGVVGIRRVAR